MNKFKKIAYKLQYLGLVGLIGTWLRIPYSEILCLFGLLVFVNGYMVMQNLLILLSLLYFKFTRKDNQVKSTLGRYSLPFEGEWFIANGGITKEDSHSWELPQQRYAYDFFMINENNQSYDGDFKDLNNYHCYKKSILAPLDGIIIEVKNKFEDTPIIGQGKVACESSDVRGNYILIQHDNNEYSLIAHLLKDSITVTVGDKVSRGDIIAKCGNSGNTSEPHIHYQVQYGKNFYTSPGIPIVFNNVETKAFSTDNYNRTQYIKRNYFARN